MVASVFLVGALLDGVLTSEAEITRETESDRAGELLAQAFPPTAEGPEGEAAEVVVVRAADGSLEQERVDGLARAIRAAGATVVETASGEESLTSADGDATALLVALGPAAEDKVDGLVAAVQRVAADPGYDAAVTGEWTADADFSRGIAFVLAMFELVLVPSSIFRSLAAGAILVALVSMVAALTLVPAFLSLLGDRVNALRVPFFGRVAHRSSSEGRFWGAIARAVMGRPVVGLVAAVALLTAAAVPVLSLETGSSGIATLPDRFAHVPADGLRRGGRAPARRHDRPLGARSRDDDPSRSLELVPASWLLWLPDVHVEGREEPQAPAPAAGR